MAKRIFLKDDSLVIADNIDVADDIRNLISNVYVEINGSLYIFYRLSDNQLIESIDFTDIFDADGVAYADTDVFNLKVISKAGKPNFLNVFAQNSTSPLLIVKASNIVAETTTTTLSAVGDYIINVNSATGLALGQYMTIYNADSNRVYFGTVLAINVLAITLDTPLDFSFPIGSFVSSGIANMNVNGSVTPVIFGIRNPTGTDIALKYDIHRLIFTCLANTTVDLSKFGDIIGGLTKGIVVRRVDGTYQNIFNAKTNAEMKNLMFDFEIQQVQGGQQDGFTCRITFNGKDKMGSVIRLGEQEDLQIIIQDDLSTLVSFTMISQGNEVTE